MADDPNHSSDTSSPGWYADASGHRRWWDGSEWGEYAESSDPRSADPPVKAEPRPAPVSSRRSQAGRSGQIVALAGSFVAVIGSIGPWDTFEGISTAGTEGDGAITFVAMFIAAVLAAIALAGRNARGSGILVIGLGLLAVLVSASELIGLGDQSEEFFGESFGPKAGWGLWFVLLGSLAATVGGFLMASRSPRP